jgi:hypothetical protein
MNKILLLGCGHSRALHLCPIARDPEEPIELVTLDINAECKPDMVFDLMSLCWSGHLPFSDNWFDEIHAYEVLEHLGQQGDYIAFFNEFTEYHRILKPGGFFFGSTPLPTSPWLWGDPGHTRYIGLETFIFLDQDQYKEQIGKTAMSDYRQYWKGDFKLVHSVTQDHSLYFGLRKE